MKYISDIYTDKIYHWVMFLETGNLGLLRKEALNISPYKVEEDKSIEAVKYYEEINDQIIKVFGLSESFLAQKEKEQEIALLKLDFIINGDKMKRTFWRIKEKEIEKPDESKKTDLTKEIEYVSKNAGNGIINIKEYTIHQYLVAKNALINGK